MRALDHYRQARLHHLPGCARTKSRPPAPPPPAMAPERKGKEAAAMELFVCRGRVKDKRVGRRLWSCVKVGFEDERVMNRWAKEGIRAVGVGVDDTRTQTAGMG